VSTSIENAAKDGSFPFRGAAITFCSLSLHITLPDPSPLTLEEVRSTRSMGDRAVSGPAHANLSSYKPDSPEPASASQRYFEEPHEASRSGVISEIRPSRVQ